MLFNLSARSGNRTFPGSLRKGLGAAVAALAMVTAGAAPAEAADFYAFACKGPAGESEGPETASSLGDWRHYGEAVTRFDQACSTARQREFSWDANRSFAAGDQGGLRVVEPAGIGINHLLWEGGSTGVAGSAAGVEVALDEGTDPFWARGRGLDAPNDLRVMGIPASAGELRIRLMCAGGCRMGEQKANVATRQLRLRASDAQAPSASNVSGALTTAGYRNGVQRVKFDAADTGTGLYRAHLEVNGTRAAARTTGFAGNGVECTPLSGESQPRSFWSLQPCAAAVTDTVLDVDTTLLADGPHAVRVVLEDAAGSEAAIYGRTLRVNNPGGTVPDTACTDGLDNDNDGKLDHGDDLGCTGVADTAETERPVSTSAPSIPEAPRSSSALGYTGGVWDDGPGANGVSTRRWQLCDAAGTGCSDIAGATSATLPILDAHLGMRLRVIETRTTSEGTAERESAPSGQVRLSNGALPACADGADNDGDGRIDLADAGCSGSGDTTESDNDRSGEAPPIPEPVPTPLPGRSGDVGRDGRDGQGSASVGSAGSSGAPGASGSSDSSSSGGSSGSGGAGGAGGASGQSGTVAVNRGPLNGAPASAQARLVAQFARTSKRTVRVAYGKAVPVTGTLVDPSGRPIRGAEVTILTRSLTRGSQFTPVATRVTDGSGRFEYMAPKGAGRVVRVAYRLHLNDVAFVSESDLEIRVTPRITLSASKKVARNKQAVTFRGSVAGAPASARKLVELQAKVGKKWVTFATTRLKAGKFAHAYRFTRTLRTTTYQFRVRVRGEASWPFAHGVSKTMRVKVRA